MANTGAVLDLTNHHFKRELHDYLVFGTWVGDTMDDSEPALVVLPANRGSDYQHVKPCCVALSSAYKYDDPKYLLDAAMIFNKGLGFEDSMTRVHKLATILHDHLQDLIEMPPRPVRESFVGGEAKLTDRETGKVHETEIIDHV